MKHKHRLTRSDRNGLSLLNHAFTLIELLVVIAIIAILAAILFPVFAQARERARAITCINNEKQIGLGILGYIQDYDETFPLAETHYGGDGDWTMLIQPYIKNGASTDAYGGAYFAGTGGVFHCPSHPRSGYGQYAVRQDLFPNTGGSVADGTYWQTGPVQTMAVVDAPANKAEMFELGAQGAQDNYFPSVPAAWWYWRGTWPGTGGPDWDIVQGDCDEPIGQFSWWAGCSNFPRYRHNKTTNVLWLDGHTKAVVKGNLDYMRDVNIPRLD